MAADAQTHVEMLLSAKDTASSTILAGQESIDASLRVLQSSLEDSNTRAENTSRTISGKLSMSMASAAVQTRDLASALLGITGGAIAKGFKFSILGPFSALFKLLSPIINAITEVLSPAFETLGFLVKNSLAPLGFLFETMAQQIAPLVQKLIAPLVSMLEVAAVHFGTILVDLLKMGGPVSSISEAFFSLMPVFMDIGKALVGVVMRLLPIAIKLVQRLLPLVVKVVEMLGKHMVRIIEQIGGLVERVGPQLIDVFIKTLEALIPLIPSLLNLAAIFVEKLLAPATIKALTFFATWMAEDAIPFIETWIPILVNMIDDLSGRLGKFFGNFGKYVTDFKVLFIDPIIGLFDYLVEKAKLLLSGLGLDDIGGKATGAFQAMLKTFNDGIYLLKAPINEYVIDNLNKLLNYDIPVVGPLKTYAGLTADIPRLALGTARTDTPSIIGEAGPEMAIPLTSANVKTVLEPILPSVQLPGMDEAVSLLRRIHTTLAGTLKVEDVGARQAVAAERSQERNDLGSAIGFSGLAGA